MTLNPDHEPIVKECEGCKKIIGIALFTPLGGGGSREDYYCESYWRPEAKWLNGKRCPLATHLEKKKEEVKAVDPLKLSKQKARGRA